MKVILQSFLFFGLIILLTFKKNIVIAFSTYNQDVKEEQINYKDSITFFESKRKKSRESKKIDSAIFFTKHLIRLYTKKNDTFNLAKSYHRAGYYNKTISNYTEAFRYLNKSFNTYSKIGDSVKAGRRLVDMSNIQNYLGDYTGSETIAVDALRYLDKTQDYKNIAGAYHSIAINKKERGDILNAEKWNERTLNLLKDSLTIKKIKEPDIINFLNTKALIQVKKQNYKKAIQLYQNLLEREGVKNDKTELLRIKDNLGYALWKKDSLDAKAIKLMQEALYKREVNNSIPGLIASNIHLSKFYKFIDSEKAITYANNALDNAQKLNNPISILEALEILIGLKVSHKLGTNKESQLYIDTNNKINDIINGNNRLYAVTKYDNEKLQKEKAQKDLEISKSQTKNLYLLFGLLLLSLLGITLYYIQKQKSRQKIKASKLQERYQTETRLSKKVHDEVGNDIFYLMTQVEKDNSFIENNGLKLLDGLQSIYVKARDISREYTDIDTEEGFPEEITSLLNSFSNKEVKIITKQLEPTFWKPINKHIKSEVFRIVQELLTNMKKHSQANLIMISFTKDSQKLTLQYSDNGIGIHQEKPTLKSVENRIHILKGVLTLDPQPDEGLQVSIIIPI